LHILDQQISDELSSLQDRTEEMGVVETLSEAQKVATKMGDRVILMLLQEH